MIEISKLASNKILFSLNFELFFIKSASFFVIVLLCIQRENVYNWNKRLTQSALNTYYFKFDPMVNYVLSEKLRIDKNTNTIISI